MTLSPKACLLLIGNEILSGRTQDTNLAFIAAKLNEAGVRLWQCRVIPDIEQVIVDTLNDCRVEFDYVFTTGGIGPTHDDITAAAVARAFGVPLARHPDAVRLLENHLGKERLNEARLKMADIPEGATLIANPVSAAPGFQIDNVFVMAGVPKIMQAMLDDILPRLKGGAPMQSVTLNCDLPEGTFAQRLGDLQARFPGVEIGSYPHFRGGGVSTSLVCRGSDAASLNEAAAAVSGLITELGGTILSTP